MILTLLACSSDFGLTGAPPPRQGHEDPAADTAAPPVETTEDTSEPEDTAAASEPDTEPVDTAVETPVDDPPPEDDCTVTDDLVYVLARDDGSLHTFDPSTLTFDRLGRVDCGTSWDPASMAVSRDGVAYVRYANNALYAVDLETLSCSVTSYSDRHTAFDSFGMGYATNASDTWRDRLYVANADTLGVIDPATWEIRTLGRMASQSELTGNAEGELWAMLPLESPAELEQLDKTSGAVLESLPLRGFPQASNIDTFAFATWDGDFYLFVRENGVGNSTDVYQVTRAGVMTKVLERVGFDVVGAGVSTCAPS